MPRRRRNVPSSPPSPGDRGRMVVIEKVKVLRGASGGCRGGTQRAARRAQRVRMRSCTPFPSPTKFRGSTGSTLRLLSLVCQHLLYTVHPVYVYFESTCSHYSYSNSGIYCTETQTSSLAEPDAAEGQRQWLATSQNSTKANDESARSIHPRIRPPQQFSPQSSWSRERNRQGWEGRRRRAQVSRSCEFPIRATAGERCD